MAYGGLWGECRERKEVAYGGLWGECREREEVTYGESVGRENRWPMVACEVVYGQRCSLEEFSICISWNC